MLIEQERLRKVHGIVANDLGAEHQKNSGTIASINKLHEKYDDSKLHQGKVKVHFQSPLLATTYLWWII